MNETEFQALFDAYADGVREKRENPIPQKLHLMVYNYALLRHQQTSDVAADFYLFVSGKLEGIMARYDARIIPFYQYMASNLNFEFMHFLRRRRLPRSHNELISIEELAERRIELQHQADEDFTRFGAVFQLLNTRQRIYAKLALAYPLTYGEMRRLIAARKGKNPGIGWRMLRGYREFLRVAEAKRQHFLEERDRLLKALLRVDNQMAAGSKKDLHQLAKRREKTVKRFFSMDTRIPIRMMAEVTGDPIATVQRQLKAAVTALKKAYHQWEKTKPDQNEVIVKRVR